MEYNSLCYTVGLCQTTFTSGNCHKNKGSKCRITITEQNDCLRFLKEGIVYPLGTQDPCRVL